MTDLLAPPFTTLDAYRTALAVDADPTARREARRRLWAALQASNRAAVARALGTSSATLRRLLEADTVPGDPPPLSTWRGKVGNPATATAEGAAALARRRAVALGTLCSVPCPECGAAVGFGCLTSKGTAYKAGHQARRDARQEAWQAKEKGRKKKK